MDPGGRGTESHWLCLAARRLVRGKKHACFQAAILGSRKFRAAAVQLYDRMLDAMRRGDWVAFGHAYDALGALLNRSRK